MNYEFTLISVKYNKLNASQCAHCETHFLIGEISGKLLDLLQIVAFDCTNR